MATISNVPKQTALEIRAASTLTINGLLQRAGAPIDLTGATLTGSIGAAALAGTITDAVAGKFEIKIEPAMIPAATTTAWYLDLVDSLGDVTPLFAGPVNVVGV